MSTFQGSHSIAHSVYERHHAKSNAGLWIAAIIFLLLVVAFLLFATGNVTLFEDGSWAIGHFPYPVSGCLPFALCN